MSRSGAASEISLKMRFFSYLYGNYQFLGAAVPLALAGGALECIGFASCESIHSIAAIEPRANTTISRSLEIDHF